MPALAPYRELFGDTNGNCGQGEGARGRRELSSYTLTWSLRRSGCWS